MSNDSTDTLPATNLVFVKPLSENVQSYISYNTGNLYFGNWGINRNNSNCTLGTIGQWGSKKWTADITAGRYESRVSFGNSRPLFEHVSGKAEISLSTAFGPKLAISSDRQLDKHTIFGIGFEYGASSGVTFRVRLFRLGQKFTIPILLSQEPDLKIAFYAFIVPVATTLALEGLLFSKWRKERRLA